ncbi:hypothetical protein LSUE1_G002315 [Lachnellula suecica]|uniref:RNase H type-1 domain-containing protein n=1 Tax=Lachnellula suecica TaxID=602035 RepID=A0A8T9CP44_9HELO|nr:hypothetical protein LSUE1_G002315 [Lachnellula suecica]
MAPPIQHAESQRSKVACCWREDDSNDYYHCNQCNVGICMYCARAGVHCKDDTHYLILRQLPGGWLPDNGNQSPTNITSSIQSAVNTYYPSKFIPPKSTATPKSLFAERRRFIRIGNPREILIYTSGCSWYNTKAEIGDELQGGCAFVFRPSVYSAGNALTKLGAISFRLEGRGANGNPYTETKNRAALRAVVGALQFCDWSADCHKKWSRVVIATNSDFVVQGATEQLQEWESQRWKLWNPEQHKFSGFAKSHDLWQLLLRQIRRLHAGGLDVEFWRIPEDFNREAIRNAKEASRFEERWEFSKIEPDGDTELKCSPHVPG